MPAVLTITVARSGGFAGVTRRWSVSAALDEADELIELVDACPWPRVVKDEVSRDRFVYVITVRAPRKRRSATVPESALTGPWKTLVKRVQEEPAEPAAPPTPPPSR
ncbi:MAG: protealysin inhibitor emfourin [Rhodoglobus sp.]